MNRYCSLLGYLLLVIAAPSLAHTKLSKSAPTDGAQVATCEEIRLTFSAPVRLTAVTLRAASGNEVKLGNIPGDTVSTFTIAVPEMLKPGPYVVAWRSISGDGHIVTGEFRFTVTG